jgi:hypothetical protein
MSYAFKLIACLMLAGLCPSIASAQHDYPTTEYQGFGHQGCRPDCECGCRDNDWPTSPPVTPDPGPCVSDHRSMSPDKWSAPSTPVEIRQSSKTPSIPDLRSKSPFQPAGYARNQKSVLTPDNGSFVGSADTNFDPTRYPLSGQSNSPVASDNPVSSDPVVAGPFNSADTWYGSVDKHESPAARSRDNGLALPSSKYSTQLPAPNYSVPSTNYRPDLGQRDSLPTIRNHGTYDSGKKYDFEDKKKQYPPMREILATGRYFGSVGALFLKPAFQGNTAITTLSPGSGESIPFDFDYEGAPQFRFGFESKYGPGLEVNYWQYDESSNPASFTSDGITTGTTSTWMVGPSRWSRLEATLAGETIDATHTIDVESIGVSLFKEVQLPISRINGTFGLQYLSIEQSMNATLSNGGGVIETLDSSSNIRAYGPRFSLEYYRPVGHTKLEFITSVGGSLMFGHRDQFVTNSSTGDFSVVGADEFVSLLEFMAGVQYKKMTAENRAVFARLGMIFQAMPGGGTAVNAQDDFGLHGYTFSVGYNR